MRQFLYACAAVVSLSSVVSSAQSTTKPAAPDKPVYDVPYDQLKWAKGYPVVPAEVRASAEARAAEWNKLERAAWEKAMPDVARAAAETGKHYYTLALDPDDLPQAKIPAFPGAEGGGMYTCGGRGGKVMVVTSLADSGPGTFREACESGGPRVVVFNVAGIIRLERPIEIKAPYLTIAGQSAPGDGVCVAGRSVHINTHDVIIRYMRFRRGTTELADRDDALGGIPVGNVIIDHCSASWGLDETMSMYRQLYRPVPGDAGKMLKLPAMNITIQWTIVSEGLNTYNHAFGATWGGRNSLFAHDLLACNTGRNCSIGMNYDFNFVNNVVFNWRHRTVDGGDNLSLLNIINNYFKPGPATDEGAIRHRVLLLQGKRSPDPKEQQTFGRYYVEGNVMEGNKAVTDDNWGGDGVQLPSPGSNELGTGNWPPEVRAKVIETVRLDRPLPMAHVTILPAAEAFAAVLDGAGATLPRRDPVDERVVNEVRTGEVTYKEGKGIITDVSQVGGYPKYAGDPRPDADADGMPDVWETRHGLNPHDPADAAGDLSGDGYTNIEKYLNGLDPKKKVDWTDLANNKNTLTRAALFGE